MNANAIFKALSNEHRLQILLWLKTPKQHFAAKRLSTAEETGVAGGVCVNAIVEKTGLTQSVVSTYLTVLKDAGLVRPSVPENGRIASTGLKPWRNFWLICTVTFCREPFF